MTRHLEIGKWGESLATDFLLKKGYDLLERNWRIQNAEIDIIVMDGEMLVFVEVKTRSGSELALPETTIGQRKKEILGNAAFAFMEKMGYDWSYRFDIVTVLILANRQEPLIRHFKDSFDPFSSILPEI